MALLRDPKGKASLRRAMGFLYLMAALVIAIVSWIRDDYMNFEWWVSLLTVGGTLLGLTGLDQLAKDNK